MDLAITIQNQLKKQHIEVPILWVSDCIEFLNQTANNFQRNNSNWLRKEVYEQYLNSDLPTLGTSCLPFNLKEIKSTFINGHFVVQVNSIRDVGKSSYSQLQKLCKQDNANTNVSADQPHQPAWQPKTCRVLMLELTDGTTVVNGMEYQPIPILSPNLSPGIKIHVSGKVEVRRGVLFLTRDCLQILGGGVDDLKIVNAAQNLLHRTLGLPASETPCTAFDELVPATQILRPSQNTQYYTSQINTQMRASGNHVTQAVQNINEEFSLDDDDFVDEDLELTLTQIEHENRTHQAINNSSNRISALQLPTQNGKSNLDFPRTSKYSDVGTNFFTPPKVSSSVHSTAANSAHFLDRNNGSVHWSSMNPDRILNSTKDDYLFDFDEIVETESERDEKILQNNVRVMQSDIDFNNSIKRVSLNQNIKTPFSQNQTRKDICCAFSNNASSVASTVSNVNPTFSGVNFEAPISNETVKPSNFVAPFNRQEKQNEKRPRNVNMNGMLNIFQPQIKKETQSIVEVDLEDELIGTENATFNSCSKFSSPFSYLCFIPSQVTSVQDFIVKGFIVTLMSRLEQKAFNWTLTVKINDGMTTLDVDVHNQVLCQLIGFNCNEFNEQKTKAKSDRTIATHISQCIADCQQQFISLSALLHLKLSPGNPRPVLYRIEELNHEHVMQLQHRQL